MAPEHGKKVVVLGLRDTGTLSALYLHEKGYRVFASDLSDTEDVRANFLKLQAAGIESECGRHSFEKILEADWALISPGIPPTAGVYQKLHAMGKPIYSEIEVASWFSAAKTVVAITGSCGKTTTATLIAQMLEASGRKTVLCGNIGNPWIGELSRITPETTVVLELSSFQLMHCTSFAPSVGLLLNVYPNHMDWHVDMREYAGAKLNLFRAMKSSGVMICRQTDEKQLFPDFKTAARRVYFDQRQASDPNEAALLCAADALGCVPEVAQKVFRDFCGIEHRLEKFAEWNGISFINDSKSTTPASLLWALRKYPGGRVVLIAGGHAKSKDFGDLVPEVRQKVKCAVLMGEATEMIRESWAGAARIVEAGSLDEACAAAIGEAAPGDTVLLSTGCASFDMFKNYQERGRLFKEKIKERLGSRVG
ncbi:MAG TPA: UDP-N-acetylmuramoyl-L-alanine--D-glutamate ligase [Candidatus Omnitrophota bacterium]|nr:UDP-N-acetylmuramoyl-L-alanine--D-glutamate ligase [Candidatus Omnitrophota bacterium]HPS36757.1 UDP-N-acetylmuramoyl-L-alanine--D-glutamate ligase [Candidatus Omnitrophota bacterium]